MLLILLFSGIIESFIDVMRDSMSSTVETFQLLKHDVELDWILCVWKCNADA
jgi:hypothetical protein